MCLRNTHYDTKMEINSPGTALHQKNLRLRTREPVLRIPEVSPKPNFTKRSVQLLDHIYSLEEFYEHIHQRDIKSGQGPQDRHSKRGNLTD